MKKPKIRTAHGPEYGIQKEICNFLRDRGWHIERLIGNALQMGLPDLLVGHPKWGVRFIEVKNSDEYNFTKAQRAKFPILDRYGFGIWILTAATEEEYQKLFSTPNWKDYWKSSWGPLDVDSLLDELNGDTE
jgi:hypothetical protein